MALSSFDDLIQKFQKLFNQENDIICDNDPDIKEIMFRNIVNQLKQCGLEQRLNNSISSTKRNTISNNDTNKSLGSKKKISGYNLFIKESLSRSRENGQSKSMSEAAVEWRLLDESAKQQYKERATNPNNFLGFS